MASIGSMAAALSLGMALGQASVPGDWTGSARVSQFSFLSSPDDSAINALSEAGLDVEYVARVGDGGIAKAAFEFRESAQDPARRRLGFNEISLQWGTRLAEARLGKQVIAWGRTDGIRPTDYFSPQDLTLPLVGDPEPRGVYSAAARLFAAGGSLEIVAAPHFRPNTLPGPRSRWIPSPSASAAGAGGLPRQQQVGPAGDPLDQLQVGANLDGSAGGWDFSLSVFEGHRLSPIYGLGFEAAPTGMSPVLYEAYARKRAVGMSLATGWGEMAFRAEGAYDRPAGSSGIPGAEVRPGFQYVLATERRFPDILGVSTLDVLFQFVHDDHEVDAALPVTDFNHLLSRAVTGRMGWDTGKSFQTVWEILYEFDEGAVVFRPEASYLLSQDFRVTVSLLAIAGEGKGILGGWRGNDGGLIEARYYF